METLAIIPARGGSKGLKRKNILPFAGKPLISYSIDSGRQSTYIDRIVVSTEDKEIAEISVKHGADVPFLRPEELATDQSTTLDVLRHTILTIEELNKTKIENIVLLQPTSPLRTYVHVDKAFEEFLKVERQPVVSVTKTNTHPHLTKRIVDGRLADFIESPKRITRRQDLEEAYELNGAIYITKRDTIIEENCIYSDVVFPFIMAKEFSVDIDDKLDFIYAEMLYKTINGGIDFD